MCGRFTLTRVAVEVASLFDLAEPPDSVPRYNIAPTQPILTIKAARFAVPLRWGIASRWGKPLINARAETVRDKHAFRDAFRLRRCLVPADGFYEWLTEGKEKRPHHFSLDVGLFALAAIWEEDGTALLTTEANEIVRPFHDRMPVILPREAWHLWLSPASSLARAGELLRPHPPEGMRVLPVGKAVGNARTEGPICLEPAGLVQRSLF